jgi:uncharacterized membrane protein YccC
MRIIKTALAITISVYVVKLLNLDAPFFAAVAALIAMQGNLAESLTMAKYRMLGSVFGGAVGVAGAYLAPGNPLVLGLGAALIIFAANKLKWQKAIVLSTVVFASIILKDSGETAIASSVSRVVNTLVGIVVAVVVNYSISRPRSWERVLAGARDLAQRGKVVLGMLICHEEADLQVIAERVQAIERELPGVAAELKLPLFRRNTGPDFTAIKARLDIFYRHLALLAGMETRASLSEENARRVNTLYGAGVPGVAELSETEVVYNYHLQHSLDNLEALFALLDLNPY